MRRRRIHPPTWKHAIETVLDTLLRVAARNPPISDEQDRILTEAYLLCDDLRTRRHRHTDMTNAELAEKYAISPRTVRNWRREGCPFERGQPHVLRWLARRRYAPAGPRAKFGKQLKKRQWGAFADGLRSWMQHARELKLAHKLNGVELPADSWLRGLRCPRQR